VTFVKICGLTDVDDALLAVALGADAVGFVFAPSKRQIAPPRARDIVARIPAEALTVGVFRNEAKERVVDIVHTTGLRAAQLHGNESPDDVAWIAHRVPTVIKAVAAGTEQARRTADFVVPIILVDAPAPGSGEVFDWSLAESLPTDRRILLAGGLDPDNVADAIATVKPWGVDVASGVEREPGRKDPSALRRFIQNAKAAGALLDEERPEWGGEPMYNWEVE
jgi:phosphoribosylanthranilate isomerase